MTPLVGTDPTIVLGGFAVLIALITAASAIIVAKLNQVHSLVNGKSMRMEAELARLQKEVRRLKKKAYEEADL